MTTAWGLDPASEIDRARALYEDAEPAEARAILVPLTVDPVVPDPERVRASHLGAVVALSLGLEAEARAHMEAAVALLPDTRPPDSYGPEIAALYDTCLAARPAIPSASLLVPEPVPTVASQTTVERGRPPAKVPLLIGGSILIAGGGAGLVYAMTIEATVQGRSYDWPSFDGCAATDACYEEARQATIDRDVRTVNLAYVASLSSLGAGFGLATTGLLLSASPGGVSMHGRW